MGSIVGVAAGCLVGSGVGVFGTIGSWVGSVCGCLVGSIVGLAAG